MHGLISVFLLFFFFFFHPFPMNFASLSGMPNEMPPLLPQQDGNLNGTVPSCFLQCYYSDDHSQQLPVADAKFPHLDCVNPPPAVDQGCPRVMVAEDNAAKQQGSGDKKRKNNNDNSSLITGQSQSKVGNK